jgi:hypothetical protein
VRWLVLHTWMSLRLGARDVWQAIGSRVVIGLTVAVLALVLALAAIHQATALWTIIAYAILLGATYGYFVVRRLSGWNRFWRRETQVESHPGGQRLNLSLHFKGPVANRLGPPTEFRCEVKDPAGVVHAANHVGGGGAVVFCAYPENFGQAAALSRGIHTVTWLERKLPGPGKWRPSDVSRVKVLA